MREGLWVRFRRCRRFGRLFFVKLPRNLLSPLGDPQQWIAIGGLLIVAFFAVKAGATTHIALIATHLNDYALAILTALPLWLAVNVIRTAYDVVHDENQLGEWHGNRFVFFEPHLVGMFRCRATGHVEMYRFNVPFVEPNAFMEFSMELDPDVRQRAAWSLGGTVHTGVTPAIQWPGTGGVKLAGREATLKLQLELNTVSVTARVFCHNFTIGEPSDTDGKVGNFKYPVRPTPDRHAGGGSP